jgi:hypothetical protein
MEHEHDHDESGNGQSWLLSRTGVATIVAVSVLGFLVYEGHGAHLLSASIYLLILACPLMHIFMHGGHGGHSSHHHSSGDDAPRKPEAGPSDEADQHKHSGGCH